MSRSSLVRGETYCLDFEERARSDTKRGAARRKYRAADAVSRCDRPATWSGGRILEWSRHALWYPTPLCWRSRETCSRRTGA